ncbi:MAG: aldose 1-epimerase [Chloroflexota bacterium]|nr:aldose 1-epimerase [Chloroflexota bacterium]
MCPCSYREYDHPGTGWHVVQLEYHSEDGVKQSALSFSPDQGCNLFRLQVDGRDYLYGSQESQGEQILLGTPVLYPTPNRVRDATFTFDGHTYIFEPNDGPNFIHGLVRNVPWTYEEPVTAKESVSASARISFQPDKEIYQLFPIRNRLELTYTLKPSGVRADFTVRNESKDKRLPFGLAIHPYFRVIGPRESVRILSPAKKWMEAVDLLPTGRLLDLEQGPADLRTPTSLEDLDLDDVFWGLEPDHPQVIYYDDIDKKIILRASELFTHSVIYTPPGQPFFCIENQSCSTDAHNLYTQGKKFDTLGVDHDGITQSIKKAAHLTILEPGESLNAWIEMEVSEQ